MIRRLLLPFTMAAALSAVLLPAQEVRERIMIQTGGPAGDVFSFNGVTLNDAQRASANEIYSTTQQQVKPLLEQAFAKRKEMLEAVKNNRPPYEVEQLADAHGELMGRVTALRTKAFAKVFSLMTPEQRAQSEQMRERISVPMGTMAAEHGEVIFMRQEQKP